MSGQRTIRIIPDEAQRGARLAADSALVCGRCEQAQGARTLDGLGPTVCAELGVQVAQVGLDGARRDRQFGGDPGAGRWVGR